MYAHNVFAVRKDRHLHESRKERKAYDILFAIMAKREVVFFLPIAKRMIAEDGLSVAFLNFHEVGDEILKKEGIDYFSLHKMKDSLGNPECTPQQLEIIQEQIGINYRRLVLHEMLTANRTDQTYLAGKVASYYTIINQLFEEHGIGCVVQELGGFIAPQLLFRISRRHNVNHVFIEPAMFPKRIVFTANTGYSDIPDYNKKRNDSGDEELTALLDEYLNQKTVIVPKKDKHFFQDMTLKRVFSADNFKRLGRKLYHKYFRRIREEYDAIGWYIVFHFIKWFRRQILRFYYTDPSDGEKYVYYPFHVPLDVQLTVRCPEFLAQESLVQYVANSLPAGVMLYLKEHPASIGGHSLGRIRDILRGGNVRLIHPRHNSFYLIRNSLCVITINSKVGFEAIMQKKPVIVLGRTFYRGKGVTIDLDRLSDLPGAILQAGSTEIDEAKRTEFLNKVFRWSLPGELYDNSEENVNKFYNSLISFVRGSGLISQKKQSQQLCV